MAEKKPVSLLSIDVYTSDFELLNINIRFKMKDVEKLLSGLIPEFPGAGKLKGKIKLKPEDLVAFATQLSVEQLSELVTALDNILAKRTQKK